MIPGKDAAGNPHWMSVFDAFYFMAYTATTIGFGEIPHELTIAQRMWVTVVISVGVIGWAYAIGTLFHTDGGGNRHICLNFATQPPARIEEGFRRLGEAWKAWQASYGPAVRRTPML